MSDIWAVRDARLLQEEQPIVNDLREAGANITSVWDLVNSRSGYPNLVPILMKHLQLPYSDRTRSGIARALAVPAAGEYWDFLVQQYINAKQGKGPVFPGEETEFVLGFKEGLACALSGSVTEERLPDLIRLAKDPSNGESRLLLIGPLRRSKATISREAVEELRHDPQLAKEINSWRKK
ncbi:hypothetical protein N1937_02970 [Rhizobium sp. WSM4643]|uniref:hypothetical protein n=1 Tax=Rhizobium sp. WSM4643 TaxID=3138253 RepID=UPI0021A7D6EB|nr:hypothetical protein [Rhizobium leguminosarum]UWM76228.1 hypothetical protein N1937_02970 [Rhizobium leguminosarum bv. viciae]